MIEPRIPEPKMRDAFRRELRVRLMRAAPAALAPRRDNAWTFLRPAFAVGLAGILLVAGAGTAAAGSLPGDPAFALKRAAEDLQVTLTFDEVQRVQVLAQLADRRVQELQTVAAAQREDRAPIAAEEVAQAVARFRAAVDAVQQAAPAQKAELVQELVDAAREKHEAVLDEVQQRIESGKAREAIERAKDDEQRETQGEKDKKDKDPSATPRPGRTPQQLRSAAPTQAPRGTNPPRSSR